MLRAAEGFVCYASTLPEPQPKGFLRVSAFVNVQALTLGVSAPH